MHDRNKLHLELGLHIMGNMFDSGGDRVVDGKQRVYDDVKAFYLEICLVQGFKGAPMVKVMVERDGHMGVHDGGDKGGVFGGSRE